jgi:hypothetical protein
MATNLNSNQPVLTSLEQMVAQTCFCKLRATCADKSGERCLANKNLYAEFMAEKRAKG